MNKTLTIRLMAAGLVGALALVTQVGAQTKGKTRPMTTKQLMAGLTKPQTTAIGTALNTGNGPADDKAWEALAINAALLTESGYTMMEDGRCPDTVWADSCKIMQDSGKTLLEKIAAKDLAGSKEAFGKLTSSCKSCHSVHHK